MCLNIRKLFNIKSDVKCPFCFHQNKEVLKHIDHFDMRIDYGLITIELNCDDCAKYYDVEIKCPQNVIQVKMQG